MGTQGRNTVTLYASQAEAVWQAVCRDGIACSREEYVRTKYGESAPVFLTAYRWFVSQAPKYAVKPSCAEFPYWAFGDQYVMETGRSSYILTLEVPVEEAVLFDMQDWNKVVQLSFIGETPAEERAFLRELSARGLTCRDVMLSGFYPDLKEQILRSWQRLFRHHENASQGDYTGISSLQAGLWCIKKEWIRCVNGDPTPW